MSVRVERGVVTPLVGVVSGLGVASAVCEGVRGGRELKEGRLLGLVEASVCE